MSLDDQTYQLIESYLSGALSNEAKKDFEKRISKEIDLAKEIELFKLMEGYIGEYKWPDSPIETEHTKVKEYVKEYLTDDVKEVALKLEKIGAEALTETKKDDSSTTSLWKVFRAAAAVLLLVGSLWFFMQPNSVNQYANNLQHEEVLLAQRGDGNQLFADAEKLFNDGKYDKAIPLLIDVDKEIEDYNVDLALGISYLETNDLANAKEMFNKIYNSDALIKDAALWYSAMTDLKIKDKAQAFKSLNKLHSEYPYYKIDEVEKLINKLK